VIQSGPEQGRAPFSARRCAHSYCYLFTYLLSLQDCQRGATDHGKRSSRAVGGNCGAATESTRIRLFSPGSTYDCGAACSGEGVADHDRCNSDSRRGGEPGKSRRLQLFTSGVALVSWNARRTGTIGAAALDSLRRWFRFRRTRGSGLWRAGGGLL